MIVPLLWHTGEQSPLVSGGLTWECQKCQNWKLQTFVCSFQLHKSEPAKIWPTFQAFLTTIFPVLWMVWLAAALVAIRDDQLFLTVVTQGCSLPPPDPGTAVLQLYLPACCCSGWAPSGWACFAEQHWELPQYQLWVHSTPACKKKRSPGKKTTLLTHSATNNNQLSLVLRSGNA